MCATERPKCHFCEGKRLLLNSCLWTVGAFLVDMDGGRPPNARVFVSTRRIVQEIENFAQTKLMNKIETPRQDRLSHLIVWDPPHIFIQQK